LGTGVLTALVVAGMIAFGLSVRFFDGVPRPGPRRDDSRLIARTTAAPKVTISAARAGACVRIVGVIEAAGSTLVAPFSGRPCVGFEGVVSDPRSGGVWAYEKHAVDFYVDDGTGRARVLMSGASLLLALEPAPAGSRGLRELLARKALRSDETDAVEGVLLAGTKVAVVGRVHREGEPSAAPRSDYRGSAAPPRVVITVDGYMPVIATNVPDLLG
jgi:hypothetical protein